MSDKFFCYSCRNTLTSNDYSRRDTCSSCGLDTRVCLNCIHHDLSYYNECKENQADRVIEKDKSNFCDYFKASSNKKGSSNKSSLIDKANSIFKKN